jgi:hypothetical protein
MRNHDEWDWLDQAQAEAEQAADEAEVGGLDRRRFVFMSVVAAAATTFGVGARAMAQGAAAAAVPDQAPAPPPPVPLGNGEPVSWTFQPYSGGVGALM